MWNRAAWRWATGVLVALPMAGGCGNLENEDLGQPRNVTNTEQDAQAGGANSRAVSGAASAPPLPDTGAGSRDTTTGSGAGGQTP